MTLGEISDLLTWGTATAYTIAMIAFATNLVNSYGPGTDSPRQRKAALSPAAHERVGVSVGASAAQPSAAAATAGAGSSGAPQESSSGAPGVVGGERRERRRTRSLGIAMSVTWLGLALHVAAVITRGVAAGRAPWANMYEFCMVGTLVAMLVFAIVAVRKNVQFLGTFVTMLSVMFLVLGLTKFHVVADGVQPALQSYWLVIHVGVAVSAAGVLTVGFIAALLQLARDSYDTGSTLLRGEGRAIRGHNRFAWPALRWRWLESIPPASRLEVLSFRINAVGFVLWTFTLIAGSIWAEHAWGRYWGWDPKEVWTFVVWVVYAAYLHARATQRWTGRRAAYFVIVGYASVLFNFTGVNILFNGKHSYSQL